MARITHQHFYLLVDFKTFRPTPCLNRFHFLFFVNLSMLLVPAPILATIFQRTKPFISQLWNDIVALLSVCNSVNEANRHISDVQKPEMFGTALANLNTPKTRKSSERLTQSKKWLGFSFLFLSTFWVYCLRYSYTETGRHYCIGTCLQIHAQKTEYLVPECSICSSLANDAHCVHETM